MTPDTAYSKHAHTHRYDLAVRGTGQGFSLTQNFGVTLSDERLGWDIAGKHDSGHLESVTAVHLQTGGGWASPIATCRITFTDDFALTVSDTDRLGRKDDGQAETYRAFVRELHRRLAAMNSTAECTAGYDSSTYQVIKLCAVLLGLIAIGIPIAVMFVRPEIELLFVLIGGLAFIVPLFTMLVKNAPQRYEPAKFPEEWLR